MNGCSSTLAENKSINFDDFSSPNSSIMVVGLSSTEFDIKLKKVSHVNLFNDTDISTSTDNDTSLVPMEFFQVCGKGLCPILYWFGSIRSNP